MQKNHRKKEREAPRETVVKMIQNKQTGERRSNTMTYNIQNVFATLKTLEDEIYDE